jgi:reactive intermediate/imine deaminase
MLPSIVIATNEGLRSVSPDRVTARSLGATRVQVIFLVLRPHVMPSILTGTRIGLGAGWATLVAAELVAATKGLGFMIKGAADFLVTDVVILGILVIAAAAIVMEIGLRVVQRVVAPWQGRNGHPPPRRRRSAATSWRQISHATEADGWLYVTGQLPADPHSTSTPFPTGIAAQAEQTFKNLKIIVEEAGFVFADTVFVRIYLTHFERDFDEFNVVYHRYFADEEHVPSRTTIGVAKLGQGALVEVDLVLYRWVAK